jgi:hypothetical protein
MIVVLVGDDDQICALERLLYPLVLVLMDRDRGVGLDLTVHTCIHHDPSVGITNLEDGIGSVNKLVPCTFHGSAERRLELCKLEKA